MSLWQSYRNLQPRTRLLVGLGVIGYAGFGILMSDQAERLFGMVPTEQDKERLKEVVPRIRVVEDDEKGVMRGR